MEQLDLDRPQADQRERVAVAESPVTAPAHQDTAEAAVVLTLAQRLAAIRDACDRIAKDEISKEKDGKKWKERGHMVEAVLAEFRPLLTKYDVDLTPNLIERSYAGNRCDIIVDFEFERLDDPNDRRVIRWAGAGTDNGDKAFAKAGTNALKEMIKKKFLVTDRDDAKEEEDKVEHQTEDGLSRKEVERLKEERRGAIEQWAKTFKSALDNAQTKEDVQRLQRDNAEQLSSPDLASVTRTFFIDLIERRKREFA